MYDNTSEFLFLDACCMWFSMAVQIILFSVFRIPPSISSVLLPIAPIFFPRVLCLLTLFVHRNFSEDLNSFHSIQRKPACIWGNSNVSRCNPDAFHALQCTWDRTCAGKEVLSDPSPHRCRLDIRNHHSTHTYLSSCPCLTLYLLSKVRVCWFHSRKYCNLLL